MGKNDAKKGAKVRPNPKKGNAKGQFPWTIRCVGPWGKGKKKRPKKMCKLASQSTGGVDSKKKKCTWPRTGVKREKTNRLTNWVNWLCIKGERTKKKKKDRNTGAGGVGGF